jgi:glycerate 2-kinase
MPAPALADHAQHLQCLRAAALQAVDPAAAVERALTDRDFADTERVFIAGAGKAGAGMARAAARILGSKLAGGVMAVPCCPPPEPELAGIHFIQGGHPTPTAGSLAAGQAIADMLAQVTRRDLVLALISGGGSALMELPASGIRLEDLRATNSALLRCGAPIHEINRVRQRLSRIKAGGLARLAYPARVLALILSDVIGDRLEAIASGLTVAAPTGPDEAMAVIEKYRLSAQLPLAVLEAVKRTDPADKERPGIDAPAAQTENRVIASNRLAGQAALVAAQDLGFHTRWLGDSWQGEAREAARAFAEQVMAAGERPACLVAGGETTVTVRGAGKGGRNQELALAAAQAIAGRGGIVIATLATDGVDGPTDAAGAVVTGDTLARATALGLDAQAHLAQNNAYPFLDALGALTRTGPTGTNVNDLLFGLLY